MTRSGAATRIDACVVGRFAENVGQHLTLLVTFQAESLVFDNHWLEFYNPTLSSVWGPGGGGKPQVEQVRGWYRLPIRRVNRLFYDLCEVEDGSRY